MMLKIHHRAGKCRILSALAAMLSLASHSAASQPARGEWRSEETVAFVNGRWFDGRRFVLGSRHVRHGRFVGPATPDRTIDLRGLYVIPPLGDAHTHNFDGPRDFEAVNFADLKQGIFYAMTMTAPASGVARIRYRFSTPQNVDVATSLGGITGPRSHPAEVYEALALRIHDPAEQARRLEQIFESRASADDAYYVIDSEAALEAKWPLIIGRHPDFLKIYLRHGGSYSQRGTGLAVGGLDPALLPALARRADEAGLRMAIANSDVSDFRLALDAGADLVTHPPCYQDVSAPGRYHFAASDALCLITPADAERAATIGMGVVLIASEWALDQNPQVRAWHDANLRTLEAAGVPLAIGSNSYGSTVLEGLIAESRRGLFRRARLLDIATRGTARMIFPRRALGCLEPGCEASFLVLRGDPLQDFDALRRIGMRVKDGLLLQLPAPASR